MGKSFLIVAVSFLLIHSCSERQWKNIYDPNSTEPGEWAPKTFVAQQISDAQVRLSWEQFDERIDGFFLHRKIGSDDLIKNYKSFDPEVRTWTDTIVTLNQIQEYTLIAFADEAMSSKLSVSCTPVFVGPAITAVINLSAEIIQVEWNEHDFPTVQSYQIYRRTGSGAFSIIKQTDQLFFIDSTLNLIEEYDYQVVAVTSNNISEPGEIAHIRQEKVGYQQHWENFGNFYHAQPNSNGDRVAGWKQDDLSLMDLVSGNLLWTVDPGQYYPSDVKFSPDDGFLVSAAGERFIKIWSSSNGNLLWSGEHANTANNKIYSFDISADAAKIASGDSREGVVNVWNSVDGSLLWTQIMTGFVSALAFNPDNTMLAGGDKNGVVSFWNATNGAFIKNLSVTDGEVTALAFSHDGSKIVISSADDTNWKYHFVVKYFSSGAVLFSGTHLWSVPSMEFSPDDALLLTSGPDDSLKVWNTISGQRLFSRYGGPPTHFSPDGLKIIGGGNAGLRVYNTDNGSLYWKSDTTGYSWNAEFIGDGSKILSSSELGLMIWEEKYGWKQTSSE